MKNAQFSAVAVLAVLALFSSLTACTSAGYEAQQGTPKGLAPGAEFSFEGNTVRYSDKDMVVEASYLSPAQADLYFSIYKEGRFKNPFPSSFWVFQMAIENRSRKDVTFNPGMAYLIPMKGKPTQPEDYTDFYSSLQLAEAEDIDERMEAFKAAALDTAKTIRPGEKAQGLLVFSSEKGGQGKKNPQDSAVLVLNNIYVGSKPRTVPLQFKGTITGR